MVIRALSIKIKIKSFRSLLAKSAFPWVRRPVRSTDSPLKQSLHPPPPPPPPPTPPPLVTAVVCKAIINRCTLDLSPFAMAVNYKAIQMCSGFFSPLATAVVCKVIIGLLLICLPLYWQLSTRQYRCVLFFSPLATAVVCKAIMNRSTLDLSPFALAVIYKAIQMCSGIVFRNSGRHLQGNNYRFSLGLPLLPAAVIYKAIQMCSGFVSPSCGRRLRGTVLLLFPVCSCRHLQGSNTWSSGFVCCMQLSRSAGQ